MQDSSGTIKTYLQEIGRHRVLTKQEEFDLFERLHGGDESAREEIIRCNLRLVVRLAQRFMGRGLNLEDLVQEGNIGLLEVISRFDHRLGFRFSTYAAFWIRQAIQVAVRKQGSLIRLPVRKARLLGRMSEMVNEYQSLHGRPPSAGELAKAFGVSEETIMDLSQISRTALSLDSPLDEEGTLLTDRVADVTAKMPLGETMRRELHHKVHGALAQLDEREHSVLLLRFGLDGHRAHSLRHISRRVGLSQEGVRRVEQRALAKLGRTHFRNQLAGLI